MAGVRPGSQPARLRKAGAEIVPVSITDAAAVRAAVQGADFVIHASALTTPDRTTAEYDEINVGGAAHLMDAAVAAGVQGVLYLSCTTLYGRSLPNWPVDEGWAFRPPTSLEESLARAERAVRTYRRQVPLAVVRAAPVFGPRDRGRMRQALLHLLDTPRAPLVGGGQAPVSLNYAPDFARAVWEIVAYFPDADDRIFHVKSLDTDWRTIVEEMDSLLHRRRRLWGVPLRVAQLDARLRPGADAPRTRRLLPFMARPHLVDDSRFRALSGFAPLFGLRAALRQTIESWADERPDLRL